MKLSKSIIKNIKEKNGLIKKSILKQDYSTVAGKSKIPKDINYFTKKENQYSLNNHLQVITDFNLIYENPKEIQLYQIGNLYTKKTNKTILLNENENVISTKTSQNMEIFKKAIPIVHELKFVSKSEMFFNNKEIKEKIENNDKYKLLYEDVLNELKTKGIKVRQASSEIDENLTGLKVLFQTKNITVENSLFNNLPIT